MMSVTGLNKQLSNLNMQLNILFMVGTNFLAQQQIQVLPPQRGWVSEWRKSMWYLEIEWKIPLGAPIYLKRNRSIVMPLGMFTLGNFMCFLLIL